jgi:hypothetical protein
MNRSWPQAVDRYLARQSVQGPWRLAGRRRDVYRGAVVIPSLAEGTSLMATLDSLAGNPPSVTERFLVVVVFNRGEQTGDAERQQNERDLLSYQALAETATLDLAWIDATRDSLAMPAAQAGVGFARKLGMDLVLPVLDWSADPLLICLDADTLVEEHYLSAIEQHYQHSRCGAAVVKFRHQASADAQGQAAIDRYELFLRSYVYGLALAGSPYAFQTVGSTMTCRARSYVRCGGMNRRKAGEDFYFLQKLAKTDGLEAITATTVYPQARVSARVPFGTGRSMARLLAGDKAGVLFYPVTAFQILATWLQSVEDKIMAAPEDLLVGAERISPALVGYLTGLDALKAWSRIQKTHANRTRRLAAFHGWFDGFRTLRLIHHLCASGLQRGEPEDILPAYFAWEGVEPPVAVPEMLTALRLRDPLVLDKRLKIENAVH